MWSRYWIVAASSVKICAYCCDDMAIPKLQYSQSWIKKNGYRSVQKTMDIGYRNVLRWYFSCFSCVSRWVLGLFWTLHCPVKAIQVYPDKGYGDVQPWRSFCPIVCRGPIQAKELLSQLSHEILSRKESVHKTPFENILKFYLMSTASILQNLESFSVI